MLITIGSPYSLPIHESYDLLLELKANWYLSIIVFIGFGFLFEKSIYIFKNIKDSNKHSNITRGELLYVFLLVSGITACSIVIFFTASRSSFLGLLIAILVTTPFIILKITRKSVRYSLLSVFFSTLLIVIISSLTLNLIIDWSSDRYRNRIMEQNLPESILQRITAKNINQSLFNLDRLDKYGKIFQDWETNQYQNLTLSKDQPHYLNKKGKGTVFEVRDDSSYRPLLKDTIDQLMLSLNKKQIIDCDEELLILNKIIKWYYPEEHFIGPTAFTSAKEFYYELPDGTQINLFDTGNFFFYSFNITTSKSSKNRL